VRILLCTDVYFQPIPADDTTRGVNNNRMTTAAAFRIQRSLYEKRPVMLTAHQSRATGLVIEYKRELANQSPTVWSRAWQGSGRHGFILIQLLHMLEY
jgi:hypothetical protein